MGRSPYFYWGVGAGVLFGVIALAIGWKLRKRNPFCDGNFDERQIAARGKAFQYGFFAYFIYYLAFIVFQGITQQKWINNETGIFVGICFATMVFAVSAIWKDAYFSLHENAKKYVVLFLLLAVSNLGLFTLDILHGRSTSSHEMNGVMGITLLIVVGAFGAKRLKDKREEE